MYGTSSVTAPYDLGVSFNAGTGATVLDLLGSSTSIRAGDMLALVQEQASPNNTLPRNCALFQATQVTAKDAAAGTNSGITVGLAAGRYNNGRPGAGNAGVFNSESSDGMKAQAYNLGQLNIVTYRIVNGNLVADTSKFGVIAGGGNVTNSTAVTPLASGIVNMQVQYGVDISNANSAACNANLNQGVAAVTPSDSDSVIEAPWENATGARWGNNGATTPSTVDLRRIRAVRIGLVARSGVLEKDCATNPPTPNPVVISWEDGTTMNPDLTADANWQCYRYKVYQTTISVRNTTWSASLNPASVSSCGLN
jgi:type IV pilus assembly protein PilW